MKHVTFWPAQPEPTRKTQAAKKNARKRFLREKIPKKNTSGNSNPSPKFADPPVFEQDACVVIVIEAVAGLVPFNVRLDGVNPQVEFAGSDEHESATV